VRKFSVWTMDALIRATLHARAVSQLLFEFVQTDCFVRAFAATLDTPRYQPGHTDVQQREGRVAVAIQSAATRPITPFVLALSAAGVGAATPSVTCQETASIG